MTPHYAGCRHDGSGLPEVHHIGLVVRDRENTLAQLGSRLGFGPAYMLDGSYPAAKVSSGITGFRLNIAFVWMGNTMLEILQPVDNRSPHASFLNERGEGLHHLGYVVSSIAAELSSMSLEGVRPPLLADGTGPGNDIKWCYVEAEAASGAAIELIERNSGLEQFFGEIYKVTGGKMPV